MVAVGRSLIDGTEIVPTVVLDPVQAGGVMATPDTVKEKPTRNADSVAKRATEKASVGKSVPIQTNPVPARSLERIGKARTTQKDQKDPEPGRREKG